jgi:deoxyribodipyrimidine photo-lyase
MTCSIVWIRRIMRLEDNMIIEKALQESEKLVFVFVFDSLVLKNFKNPEDRRLSFITKTLESIDSKLAKIGAKIHILYGDPIEEIPVFAKKYNAKKIFTEKDFEPYALSRDKKISDSLQGICEVELILDHLLLDPSLILKDDGTAFKVFTPFMKAFRNKINNQILQNLEYSLENRVLREENSSFDLATILQKAGYNYIEDKIWKPEEVDEKYTSFLKNSLSIYHDARNNLYPSKTSKISPYLRFGQLSIRRAFRDAMEIENHPNFVNELIWREFYAYIMYHFPYSIEQEFQLKYRNKIDWKYNEINWQAFCAGKTGFPVVDAAIRQLLQTGWMHNRARMIVASFLTKNLFFDWRLGEKFFAEYLMDYELSSNVGGWQWTASTGTDAQPYFRVFNPISQAEKFDPTGEYIRKYVPELSLVKVPDIYDGEIIAKNYNTTYPKPIVDYKSSREFAISNFKEI